MANVDTSGAGEEEEEEEVDDTGVSVIMIITMRDFTRV